MTVQTVTHLNFRGEARAALAFYHSVFGGEQIAVTYKDFGKVEDPADADQVIWGQVVSTSGFRVMAFDVPSRQSWHPGERSFFVSVRGESTAEIEDYWDKLVDGGSIVQALGPSNWSPLYGMVKDRFGITWVMDVAARPASA
jgi:PhnB protein